MNRNKDIQIPVSRQCSLKINTRAPIDNTPSTGKDNPGIPSRKAVWKVNESTNKATTIAMDKA
ncbi:MAG: hypothetical protein A3H23_00515 [Planctomycetes bacterium RIFCSPLOWO2_12_FULL_40_19]|nr:MAG: hypothetical protein A3H23_00515 [Planctomycetes bacterium RIFCSPLOWO2_12_FULL_40_19]